ncbi:rRNA adenine N(6)-methyltransferase [Parastagonospora nodorum]|nr:rRNA adenine N(6)-methyltransferase [Parastagonospora nodorum]KAH4080497.1 rRNA adenine N(6)-methyltransferase [Parastagonospora nodorum]KAH4917070.1 rRNA adenine N(6)-methyltransferase [Parastagonospora nodorum]KAH4975032.1 rRNA adenine N(6)-methyltransferase [Parastagonospora nodorum]KAH5127493.1 rRNA adenine N(6)-methyltransferase [Parastagonospora nodorum]
MGTYWTPKKLAISERYPLTADLHRCMHPALVEKRGKVYDNVRTKIGKLKTSAGVVLRTQIVSPDLCDDVLKYMAHTLELYKGCDILDINPGVGLWSQKLHEFLKPRNHILLEPSPDLFRPFLDPLLNAPDSKYKLVNKDPLKVESYRELVDEGAFPQQTRIDPQDPKGQDLNQTLLVTGSLAWDPFLPGLSFDSMAKQLYHHFTPAAWSNDLFHAFGPVRTLFWVQTEDFNHVVAKSPTYMLKSNRLLEMTQNLNLVVTSERESRPAGKGAIGREPQYEIESTIRAIRSAKKAGFDIPEHRRDVTHKYAELIEEASGGSGIINSETMMELMYAQYRAGNRPTQFLPQGILDCFEVEKQLQEEHPDLKLSPIFPLSKKTAATVTNKAHPASDKVREYTKTRALVAHRLRQRIKFEEIVIIGEEIYKLECKALKMKEGPGKAKTLKQIEQLEEQWDQRLAQLSRNLEHAPVAELDDRINLRYPPHPRIQWDQRLFDPLMSREDEVWPRNRVSLISATPIPRPASDDPEWHEQVIDFVFGLYANSNRSVIEALDSMQHGLSDIIKDCPSLTDPDKGGRLQLKHLRVKLLTMEMIYEMAKAYKEWPFKAPGSDRSLYFRHKN